MQSATIAASAISTDQIADFDRDGYLVVRDAFTTDEIDALRAAAESDDIYDARDGEAYRTRTVHLLGLTARHPTFMDLARNAKILERIAPLIGDDIQLQHSKLATKPPAKGVGQFGWHQDFAFFPHTNTDLVAVMVALDDCTPENGCLQVIPGSHKLGLLDHIQDGMFTAACQVPDLWADEDRVVNIEMCAGSYSIHHCLTLHGSQANLSGQDRRTAIFQYRADDAYQLADGIWPDTGLLMRGRRRERARCDAGVLRLPKTRRYSGSPFGDAWNQEGELAAARDHYAERAD